MATSGQQQLLNAFAQSDVDMKNFRLLNVNFSGSGLIPLAYLSTDGTLSADSDILIASQKATKTYADTKVTGTLTTDGTFAANLNTLVPSQKAIKTYAQPISTGSNFKFLTTSSSGLIQPTTVTASSAVATDVNGLPTASTTTATELAFVHGVTSALQTQINATEKTANKGAASGYAPLVSSLVPTANLGSGSATSSTFLRGDQTWAGASTSSIPVTSKVLIGDGAGNATTTTETGTGNTVRANAPTFVAPVLGAATCTTINKFTLTTPATGITITGTDGTVYTLPPLGFVGYMDIPTNAQSANYTTVLADAGKCIKHPAADANARTFTIDSHANVTWRDGTAIMFENMSANSLSIAITTDTMYLAGTGTTGTRTLAQYGRALARYTLATTDWIISGVGLS